MGVVMEGNLDLHSLFNPKNIAIVGASSNPGSISGQFLRYLKRYEFKGEIYPVNPRHQEIAGLPCFPSVSAITRHRKARIGPTRAQAGRG